MRTNSILRFRHHASIVVWCGRNEGVPQPIINEGLAELMRTLDHTRYYTGSSNQVNLRNSGPYQLQTPETYYRINRGFSVELGIPSVPTLESIYSFIPEPDRWPISDTWAYHDWHQSGNGAVAPFMAQMETEFGAPDSLEDFERKAQMLDYVGHRAIFEGFAAHLWQPNSARHDLDDAAGVAEHGMEFPEFGLRHAVEFLRNAEGLRTGPCTA